MVISDKLKKVIFKKLYEDLSHVEIIPYNGSVWFIDRENKYWYFEYMKSGKLWWKWDFSHGFFYLFSLDPCDFGTVLGEWVEEVLNCRVLTTEWCAQKNIVWVEEVLNCRVLTTDFTLRRKLAMVEEVLNCRVLTTLN